MVDNEFDSDGSLLKRTEVRIPSYVSVGTRKARRPRLCDSIASLSLLSPFTSLFEFIVGTARSAIHVFVIAYCQIVSLVLILPFHS